MNCSTDVARLLQGEERQELRHLMDRYNKSIQVMAQQNYHREQYDIYCKPAPATEGRAASPPANGLQRDDGSGPSSASDENRRRPEPAHAREARGVAPLKPAVSTNGD